MNTLIRMDTIHSMSSRNFREKDYDLSEILSARNFSITTGRSAILYHDRMTDDDGVRKKKSASKTKYTCPICGLNAWAKPESRFVCSDCQELMQSSQGDADQSG